MSLSGSAFPKLPNYPITQSTNTMQKKIKIDNITIGQGLKPALIAGPCVIENESLTVEIASTLKQLCAEKKIPFIFKASYAKANRSSGKSFATIGFREALGILERVKAETDVVTLTDVHETVEVLPVADVVDIIQIPAFLCRQTELVQRAAQSGKIVNIKKGQFMSPYQMKHILEKAAMAGNRSLMLTERGTFFGYGDLVVDMRSLPVMASFGYPILYDATHSVQKPAGMGDHSGGNREFILPLARAAAATGSLSGIYMETHPEPEKSPSDSASMLPLNQMSSFIDAIWNVF